MEAIDVLTLSDAARELGRSRETVYHYRRHFGLPTRRVGAQVVIDRGEFEAWKANPEIAARLATGAMLNRNRRTPKLATA